MRRFSIYFLALAMLLVFGQSLYAQVTNENVYIRANSEFYKDENRALLPILVANGTGSPPSGPITAVGDRLYYFTFGSGLEIVGTDLGITVVEFAASVAGPVRDLYARDCERIYYLLDDKVMYLNVATGQSVLITEVSGATSIVATDEYVYFIVGTELYRSDFLGVAVAKVNITMQVNPTLHVAYHESSKRIFVSYQDTSEIYSFDTTKVFHKDNFEVFTTVIAGPSRMHAGDHASMVIGSASTKYRLINLESNEVVQGSGQLDGGLQGLTGVNDPTCSRSGGGSGDSGGGTDSGGSSTGGGGSSDSGGDSSDGGSSGSGGDSGGDGGSGGTADACSQCSNNDGDPYPECCGECQNLDGQSKVCESQLCDSNPLKTDYDDVECGGCATQQFPVVEGGNVVCQGIGSYDLDGDGKIGEQDACPQDPFNGGDVCACGQSPLPDSLAAQILAYLHSETVNTQIACSTDTVHVGKFTQLPRPQLYVLEVDANTADLLVKYIAGNRNLEFARDSILASKTRKKRKQAERSVATITVKTVNLKTGQTKVKRVKDKAKELREKTIKVKADPDIVYVVDYKVGLEAKKNRKDGNKAKWKPVRNQQTAPSNTTITKPPSSLFDR
ncbi:MAG: hypothetical protein KDD62_10225 [Bdellovibrionales bacterium]|nr:hypothetical protein [Bdellovibrionales bacterium]